MTLKADNLIKSFGGLRAVDGVSFEAHAGALTCITGPNGAGKTTVFNLLTGFDTPDDGRIPVSYTHLAAPHNACAALACPVQAVTCPS